MLTFLGNLVQQYTQFFVAERNKYFCTLSTKGLRIDFKVTFSIMHKRKTINGPI